MVKLNWQGVSIFCVVKNIKVKYKGGYLYPKECKWMQWRQNGVENFKTLNVIKVPNGHLIFCTVRRFFVNLIGQKK